MSSTDSTDNLIIDWLKEFWDQRGYSPSGRAIGRGVGLSSTAIHHRLHKLIKAGCIDNPHLGIYRVKGDDNGTD